MKKVLSFIFIFVMSLGFTQNIQEKASFKLFCGTANPELAKDVAIILGKKISNATVNRYNDGEINIQIKENIRGQDVFIIQSTCSTVTSSVNDTLMELFLLIRSCKRAAAKSINVVIPYFGYARQDRKIKSRVPISASDVAILLENSGADHVLSFDLHCGQIQGFFHNIPVDNLMTTVVFVPYFASKNLEDVVIVAPDAGAIDRAKKFIDGFEEYGISSDLALIVKQRKGAGVIETMNLVGDVNGKDVIIVDDMCDTAGTLTRAALELKKNGAKRIYACVSHPVFSPPALERIKNSVLTELVVTDTIPLKEESPHNVKQISIAPLIAEAIRRSHNGESLSHLYKYHN